MVLRVAVLVAVRVTVLVLVAVRVGVDDVHLANNVISSAITGVNGKVNVTPPLLADQPTK